MPVTHPLDRIRPRRLTRPAALLTGVAAACCLLAGTSGVAHGAPTPVPLTSPACPAVLAQGEQDGCVTELQNLLDTHGASIAADGDFGPTTTTAVKGFQSAVGLAVDGQVGPATKGALYASPTAAVRLTSPHCAVVVRQGERDGCVTELQRLLNGRGASLTVDGDFGPGTLTAVENFQAANGLGPDGLVGPATKAELYGEQVPPTPVDQGAGRYAAVVGYATAALNAYMPYVWGGGHDGPTGPSIGTCSGYSGAIQPCPADRTVGLDCSGLARWAYWQAGVGDIGQITDNQIANPRFHQVAQAGAVPGDLVFFGPSTADPAHVGIYTGAPGGVPTMINAPATGRFVTSEPVAAHSSLLGYYHYS
ncbi:peptidoglycan-binding protein [Kitasatospora sp. NBC_00240]|uniref:C40 family peptidase n=1 Tax=Kitasatospora sp. NBC_00240 TaxID=2903567 RepID=UPI00224FE2EB|nr:peptidoglycan-binding protein [Kitasatospora sp. NBC_00240]MCX5215184.1 peptidoglycan-binding protein [Kitasatospora sp. NBC_00240]